MTCNVEISGLKKNAILYLNEKGKVISVSKEEFLKEHSQEIKNLKFEWEQKNAALNLAEEKRQEEFNKKMQQVEEYLKSIYDFISIMKGGK